MGLVAAGQAADPRPQEDPRAVAARIFAAPRDRFPSSRRDRRPAGALGRQDGARRSLSVRRARARRRTRPRARLAARKLLAAAVAGSGALLLDAAAGRRAGGSRPPRKVRFYESGQDVTGIDDPLTSYRRFIDRVIREYDNLSTIFKFVTVNAEEAVYRQHQHVREAGRGREAPAVAGIQRRGDHRMAAPRSITRTWVASGKASVAEARAGRLIAVDGAVGRDVSGAAIELVRLSSPSAQAASGVSRWDASGLFTDVAVSAGRMRDALAAHAAAPLCRRSRLSAALGDSGRRSSRAGHRRCRPLCDDGDRLRAAPRACLTTG